MSQQSGSKNAFIICPIGKDGSSTRKRSDKMLKHVFRAVLEPLGYAVDRADQLSEPGVITNQIVKGVVDCDILIADLSEHNPNVFYELAIRHGLKKPFIHVIDAAEAIPFDNAQVRTITIDLSDLDSVERAKSELSLQVLSIEGEKHVVESPISIAFDLDALKSSGNTDEALLVTIFQELSSLRSDFRDLRRQNTTRNLTGAVIRDEDDLFRVLSASEASTLSKVMQESVTVHKVEPFEIVLTTNLSPEDDRRLEIDLTAFLRSKTGKTWNVEIVPF